jgi:hypothetical protein
MNKISKSKPKAKVVSAAAVVSEEQAVTMPDLEIESTKAKEALVIDPSTLIESADAEECVICMLPMNDVKGSLVCVSVLFAE